MESNSKPWKWMVGVLTALNITLLVFMLMHHGRPAMHGPAMPPPHNIKGGGPAQMLIHELNFTPEQIKSFDALKEQHHEIVMKLREQGHDLRDNYFELLKSDSPDTNQIKEKGAGIAANQLAIEEATFNHFKEVRNLCNPEQKKRFDSIINDVIKMLGKPGPSTGGPPPHGGPEGPPPPPMH